MNRRAFLAAVAALPFVGKWFCRSEPDDGVSVDEWPKESWDRLARQCREPAIVYGDPKSDVDLEVEWMSRIRDREGRVLMAHTILGKGPLRPAKNFPRYKFT